METKQAFENMPVAKAVLVNAVPAMLSMLVTLVYNVADTFFIGQTGDEMQVAAVSLATPVWAARLSSPVPSGRERRILHARSAPSVSGCPSLRECSASSPSSSAWIISCSG